MTSLSKPGEPPAEHVVAHAVAEVLNLEFVDVSRSFHDYGGTSLQAIRICARLARLGLRIAPERIFDSESLAGFALLCVTEGRAS